MFVTDPTKRMTPKSSNHLPCDATEATAFEGAIDLATGMQPSLLANVARLLVLVAPPVECTVLACY